MFSRTNMNDAVSDARSTAHKTAKQVRDRAADVMTDVRGRADEFVGGVHDRLPVVEDLIARVTDNARRLISERPGACIAAVGILGVLIGLSCRSRD